MIPVERFEGVRPYQFSSACRILGNASDTEDV
jgi:hypothetical protein